MDQFFLLNPSQIFDFVTTSPNCTHKHPLINQLKKTARNRANGKAFANIRAMKTRIVLHLIDI